MGENGGGRNSRIDALTGLVVALLAFAFCAALYMATLGSSQASGLYAPNAEPGVEHPAAPAVTAKSAPARGENL